MFLSVPRKTVGMGLFHCSLSIYMYMYGGGDDGVKKIERYSKC